MTRSALFLKPSPRLGVQHRRGAWAGYARLGKRALDIGITLALSPIWVPLAGVLIALAWCEGGQGLFGDERIGHKGRIFTCWKIRTLPVGTPRGNAESKRETDKRCSLLGRSLRRASLDELPQFWCVLKGEMSLVGPRPVPETELAQFGPARLAYLSTKPGMTGPWQTSGRNRLPLSTRIALDAHYAKAPDLWSDLLYLALTAKEIVTLNGR